MSVRTELARQIRKNRNSLRFTCPQVAFTTRSLWAINAALVLVHK